MDQTYIGEGGRVLVDDQVNVGAIYLDKTRRFGEGY